MEHGPHLRLTIFFDAVVKWHDFNLCCPLYITFHLDYNWARSYINFLTMPFLLLSYLY